MKIYGIVNLFEDNFRYDEHLNKMMFTQKEDAYKQIISEIKNGEFENPYGESIILDDSDMPDMDILLTGWWYKGDIYSMGYKIREYYLSD